MAENNEQESPAAIDDKDGRPEIELLAAESILKDLGEQLANECTAHSESWPRDWMQKNVIDREILIKARNIILDRVGR